MASSKNNPENFLKFLLTEFIKPGTLSLLEI